MSPQQKPSDPLTTLARLALGSVLVANEDFERRLREWDERAYEARQEQIREHAENARRFGQYAQRDSAPLIPSDPLVAVRHVALGALVDTRRRLQGDGRPWVQIPKPVEDATAAVVHALEQSELLAPARQQFDAYVERGEEQVRYWEALGRREEQYSRLMTRTAVVTTVESTVTEVTRNPQVVELVQAQSVGILTEVLEEFRERVVALDILLRRFFGRLVGRAPVAVEDMAMPPDYVRENLRKLEMVRKASDHNRVIRRVDRDAGVSEEEAG